VDPWADNFATIVPFVITLVKLRPLNEKLIEFSSQAVITSQILSVVVIGKQ
jgi:hypothetical protein